MDDEEEEDDLVVIELSDMASQKHSQINWIDHLKDFVAVSWLMLLAIHVTAPCNSQYLRYVNNVHRNYLIVVKMNYKFNQPIHAFTDGSSYERKRSCSFPATIHTYNPRFEKNKIILSSKRWWWWFVYMKGTNVSDQLSDAFTLNCITVLYKNIQDRWTGFLISLQCSEE